MKKSSISLVLVLLSSLPASAHDWHRHEDPPFANLQALSLAEAEIIAEEKLDEDE